MVAGAHSGAEKMPLRPPACLALWLTSPPPVICVGRTCALLAPHCRCRLVVVQTHFSEVGPPAWVGLIAALQTTLRRAATRPDAASTSATTLRHPHRPIRGPSWRPAHDHILRARLARSLVLRLLATSPERPGRGPLRAPRSGRTTRPRGGPGPGRDRRAARSGA